MRSLLFILKCKIAILSLTASSLGLTLTATSTVIFAEMSWTPATLLQAEDRAHSKYTFIFYTLKYF